MHICKLRGKTVSTLGSGQDSFKESCIDNLGKNIWWHAVKESPWGVMLQGFPTALRLPNQFESYKCFLNYYCIIAINLLTVLCKYVCLFQALIIHFY